jgi:peptide/nickel transport system substrate-binding protein
MQAIITFDLGNPDSPYYDESLAPNLEQFLSAFRGMRIVSADPMVFEFWSDSAQLDAENMVSTLWPTYDYGDAAWHNMALMLLGEEDGLFAFTPDKAEANEIERTNMIAGPSLDVFATELVSATAEAFIPYAPTLGQFITADEAVARYDNLTEFARRYGHYYLGTNVYYLQGVFPVERQAILQRYAAQPDRADKFAGFSAPALAQVEVDGDSRVTIGDEASFDVFIDVFGGAYAVDDIDSVTYLLYDATGAQVAVGAAEAVEDGLWQVTLSGDVTSALAEGSNRLDIVVVSKLVALPSLGTYAFVTAP